MRLSFVLVGRERRRVRDLVAADFLVLQQFGIEGNRDDPEVIERARTGAVISYCLGWLRQAENQYLACPPAIAAKLPERLQRLLGYFVHAPNLGCLEGQDPIHLLSGRNLTNGRFEEFLPPQAQEWLDKHKEKLAQAA